jgi:hypothetical protein
LALFRPDFDAEELAFFKANLGDLSPTFLRQLKLRRKEEEPKHKGRANNPLASAVSANTALLGVRLRSPKRHPGHSPELGPRLCTGKGNLPFRGRITACNSATLSAVYAGVVAGRAGVDSSATLPTKKRGLWRG